MKKLVFQIIKFCAVGGICFVIDYLILILLTEFFGINAIVSSAISFSVSTVVNYVLNILFVFKNNKPYNKFKNFFGFVLISAVGLLINQAVMAISVNKLKIYYLAAKIISAVIVTAFNFVAKKFILEQGNNRKI